MDNPTNNCAKCFSTTAALSRQTFANQHEALSLVRKLVLDGIYPVLCRSDDVTFRVCHERPST